MVFNEDDIDFHKLDWKQFEELCYDLLVKFQYHSLAWRQGGADKGRDIEAKRYVTDTITEPFLEKWFVECKRYTHGLPVDEVMEKVSWAEMEKADHFLLIVSSYLTQQTREWLDAAAKIKAFKVHLLEGKALKSKLLLYPDIIIKYFADDYARLVRSMLMQWLYHDILPEPKALYNLHENLNFTQLNDQELGFLWYAFVRGQEAIEDYWESEHLTPIEYDVMIPFDFLIPHLKAAKNSVYPVMKVTEQERFFGLWNGLGLGHYYSEEDKYGFSYVQYEQQNGERVQVVLIKEDKRLEVRIGVGYRQDVETLYNSAKS